MAGGCYFYATRTDILSVLDFIFASTELDIFEAYSRTGHPVRSFESLSQLLKVQPERDSHGTLHLKAHSQHIYAGNIVEEINLAASVGGGIRYSIESPAAIQILEASPISHATGLFMDVSRIACLTEAGARQRSFYSDSCLDAVDWKQLASVFSKIERHIRRNLTASRWAGRAVLQDAERERINGKVRLWPQV